MGSMGSLEPVDFEELCTETLGFELKDCILCGYLQWLPEQMECRNAQIRKPAVSLWIPMTQKWFIPHFKALNVSFNLKYQTLQKL